MRFVRYKSSYICQFSITDAKPSVFCLSGIGLNSDVYTVDRSAGCFVPLAIETPFESTEYGSTKASLPLSSYE